MVSPWPLVVIGVIVVFIILFFKLNTFRKYRIWLKIRWRFGIKLFKHFYYDVIYVIKLTAFLKTLVFVGLGLGFIFILVIGLIYFWNYYLVELIYELTGISAGRINLPAYSKLFGQFNIFWILGAAGGSLLSVFIKPKLDKFADKVNAKPYMIYIFGSNTLTQKVVSELIKLGLGPMVALIAERKYYWIEELGKSIDILILDSPEELRMPTIYDRIKFQNALKVISLVDGPEDNQHIIINIRRNNPSVEIITLSRNKPYILDLVGEEMRNITLIEDFETITREIIRRLALGFIYAPVIECPVPEDYINRTPKELESDFEGKIKILGVRRGTDIIMPEKFNSGDRLLMYITNEQVLREFLQLIPVIIPEEVTPEVTEGISVDMEESQKEKEPETKEGKDSLIKKLKSEKEED